jgi:uncharacterized protein YndB with AHSA1/START domain
MTGVVQETDVPAASVWALWADVPGWAAWNPDVTAASIDGPFSAGAVIAMTLTSGDVVDLTLVDVEPGVAFTDEASLDGIVLRTEHRIEPGGSPAHSRIVYDMTASGSAPPDVLEEVRATVSADFPETLAALLQAASCR